MIENAMMDVDPSSPKGTFQALPEGQGSMMKLTEGSSLRGTVFNLVNSMMGAGILGLPLVFAECGVLVGISLLVFVAVLSDLTVWMLVYCLDATRERSYAGVATVLYGRRLGLLIDFIIFSNNLGTMISYVIIIGDLVPPFMAYLHAPMIFHDRTSVMIMISLPLLMVSSLKKMDALRHVSLVCIFMILVFVVSLVAMGTGVVPATESTDEPVKLWSADIAAIMRQVPVIVFAVRCQQNVPIFYSELRRQKSPIDSKFATKRSKMMAASHISTFTAAFLYAVAATCGYLAFRQRTVSDVLVNFNSEIFAPAAYVRGCYAMVIICSYPVMAFSAVVSFHRLAWHVFDRGSASEEILPDNGYVKIEAARKAASSSYWPQRRSSDVYDAKYCQPGETYLQTPRAYQAVKRTDVPPPGDWLRICEVAGMVAFTVTAAMLIPDITVVFGLTGGLCASSVMYVFPPMMFLKVKKDTGTSYADGAWEPPVFLGYFVLLFGIAVSIGSTSLIMFNTFFPSR